MSRPAPLRFVTPLALTIALVAASSALAGPPAAAPTAKGFATQPRVAPSLVQPPIVQPPVVQPNRWFFGMSLLRTNTVYGPGLYVTSVVPGGPAWAAGLERGDVLLSANGVSFQSAASAHHGVALLQSAVGGVATTVAYPGTFVAPPQPSVRLVVVNVRTNGVVSVTVRPRSNNPIPVVPPAPVAAFPAGAGTR